MEDLVQKNFFVWYAKFLRHLFVQQIYVLEEYDCFWGTLGVRDRLTFILVLKHWRDVSILTVRLRGSISLIALAFWDRENAFFSSAFTLR